MKPTPKPAQPQVWDKAKREAHAEKMRASWAARKAAPKSASPSQPLNSSPESSAPSPLPSPAQPQSLPQSGVDRVLGMLKTLEAREAKGEAAPKSKEPARQLPDDPDERDKALSLSRIGARPVVVAVDELLKTFDQRGLSKQEREEGLDAWAALFWFYGLSDPRLLVLLWGVGVAAPRAAEAAVNSRRKKKGLPPLHRPNVDSLPESPGPRSPPIGATTLAAVPSP